MVSHVLKKSGKKQAFSIAKLKKSIEKSAKDAKLNTLKTKKLVEDVITPLTKTLKKIKIIKASALRKSMLGRIERRAKSVATTWKRFDKKKK